MKKIIAVLFAVAMVVNEAYAFKAFGHQTIAALAEMHMTEKAKSEVRDILQSDMTKHAMWLYSLRKKPELVHTQEWQISTLNAAGKSVTTYENDAVVALERAVEVLRNRKNESDSLVQASLRTVVQIVGDIHTISNIRIEGNEATKGFTFSLYAITKGSSAGEKEVRRKNSWHTLWHNYTNRHDVFSPQYYATDLNLCYGSKKAEYEKGTPRFWAENVGEDVVSCLKVIYPDAVIPTEIEHRYEEINDKCMAKAGYRLAALLNSIFK
jgi:hypothetical protein